MSATDNCRACQLFKALFNMRQFCFAGLSRVSCCEKATFTPHDEPGGAAELGMSTLKAGQIERWKTDIDVFEHVGGGVQMYRPPKQVNDHQRASARRRVIPRTHQRHVGGSGSSTK